MNVLILAAGQPLDPNGAEPYPVWLTEMEDGLVLERQVRSLTLEPDPHFTFCFRERDVDAYHLRDIVEQMAPGSSIVTIRRQTQGAACTALLAIGEVAADGELMIASATDHIEVDYAEVVQSFRDRGADAGVMTFESLHPRYSYVRLGDGGWVVEAAEKRPISRIANAGFYWFRHAGTFFRSLQSMILKDVQVQDRFFISPSLNELILEQKKIATYPLQPHQYHPVKAVSQVEAYEHALERRLDEAR